MNESEIYEYLKRVSLFDIISLVMKQSCIETSVQDSNVYYTAKDLFRLYPNVFSKYKLDKYIKEENLPVIKNGKERLFIKSNVEAWLKNKNCILYESRGLQ